MASTVEEKNNVEYDSDPEEAKRPLTMRRREASDDEVTEAEAEAEGEEVTDKMEDSRVEVRSDDEGGVEDYDDDVEEEEEELEEEEEEEEVEVEEEVYEEKGATSGGVEVDEGSADVVKESQDDVRPPLEDSIEDHSEEKKENEPFAVPTAGAFYMHDDRFRDNAGARQRRIHGERSLWESKDDRKWGHDKFEEITLHEKHHEERGRPYKGNYRGRGKSRGTYRGGYVQGNRTGYNDSSNQNQVPKRVVKGRGPQKYERTNKSNGPSSAVQNKHSERTSTHASKVESGSVPVKNQVVASNLNSASPPFYPSGSSNKDINLAQKREVQTGGSSRNISPVVVDEGFPVQQNNARLRGNNVVDSISMAKLYIDESIPLSVGKPGSSAVSASQSPSPLETSMPISSHDSGEVDAASESGKVKGAMVGKGREGSQGAGRGSFIYGGAQVMGTTGNAAVSHGDPNFPAFLPVMQFGGKHPGGMGVPTVGMAFPGYVAQPQLGLGKSEMTWLPVLAGSAGALGATYPFLPVDGASNQQSGQASALGTSSKEHNVDKDNHELKPPQRSELASDEFEQWQNKPRRYSEMNFGQ